MVLHGIFLLSAGIVFSIWLLYNTYLSANEFRIGIGFVGIAGIVSVIVGQFFRQKSNQLKKFVGLGLYLLAGFCWAIVIMTTIKGQTEAEDLAVSFGLTAVAMASSFFIIVEAKGIAKTKPF